MNNYPDDIRQYDTDPRSPFFTPAPMECHQCGHNTPEDEALTLFEGSEHVFCDTDCIDKYVEENAGYVYNLMWEKIESLTFNLDKSMRKAAGLGYKLNQLEKSNDKTSDK